MTTATATKNARTLIAEATAVVNGVPQRGTVDLRTAFGGLLTVKISNAGVAPTTAPTINVLVAHTAGGTPAAASAGNNWKTWVSIAGDVTNNSVNEYSWDISEDVMHLEVEIVNNSGTGSMTGEAFLSELTSISNA